MASRIKKNFGEAGAQLANEGRPLYDVMVDLVKQVNDLITKFNAHKHSFDATAGIVSAISNTPVTGTTTGTAAGGTATSVTIAVTVD